MATVQAYTKSGVDAKFNARSNMTMVHNGGGSPDIAAYPDSKTGDVIERSSDGARWSVVASTVSPIAGRVVSVSGKTGVVTLGPGDVGASPASHTHTKAQITDLNASTSATANSVAQRGTGGVLVVGTPTATTHATTKAYVDSRITGGITWNNLSGKPSTFPPASHTHTMAEISNLPSITYTVSNGAVVLRTMTGQVLVPVTPTEGHYAASKGYVDSQITGGITWNNLSGKPSTFTPSTHSHTQAQVTGLPAKLTRYDNVSDRVDNRLTSITGSTTDAGRLLALTSTGRLGSVNPINAVDVANKRYVDDQISEKTTWANTSGKPTTFTPSGHSHPMSDITNLPSISALATSDTLARRDSHGRLSVNQPVSDLHATSKSYVDRKFESSYLSTQNLDDIITPGAYFQTQSVNATTARNYPADASAGHLVVMGIAGYAKQEYTDYLARSIHYRTMSSNVWNPWKSISQTEA